MTYSNTPSEAALKSINEVRYMPFWLDDPNRPEPQPLLARHISTELLIIGGGFTGLWTAILAKEEDPRRAVVLLEAEEIANGASGRNGGFVDQSITHGLQNGLARWPGEFPTLLKMGRENLDAIESSIERLGIECDYRRVGDVLMASEPYQVNELRADIELIKQFDIEFEFYDQARVQEI